MSNLLIFRRAHLKQNESRYGIDSQTKGDDSRVMYDGYHRAHQGFNCGSVARRRDQCHLSPEFHSENMMLGDRETEVSSAALIFDLHLSLCPAPHVIHAIKQMGYAYMTTVIHGHFCSSWCFSVVGQCHQMFFSISRQVFG